MKIQTIPALTDAHKKLNMFTGITTDAALAEIQTIIERLARVDTPHAKMLIKIIEERVSRCSLNSEFVALAVWAYLIEMGDL